MALTLAAGCSHDPQPSAATTGVRVSGFALKPITCEVASGSSAYVKELVLVKASRYLSAPRVVDERIVLQRLPGKDLPPEKLAGALHCKGLTDVHVESGAVVARLEPDAEPPSLDNLYLDLGPFREAEYSPGRLVLERRAGAGISAIELISFHSDDEEWRRFLGREVDLVPSVRTSFIRYLSEVPSIRLLPVEQPQSFGIVFHVSEGPFVDVRLRRAIARALRRHAIAKVAVGGAELAVAQDEDAAKARELIADLRARKALPAVQLIVPNSWSEATRAALVVEQQLSEIGLDITLEPLDFAVADERVSTGKFGMILMNAGLEPFYYRRAVTGNVQSGNITGYSNLEFDHAVATGNHKLAREILERDVPMTPLYVAPDVVAIDRRWCGAHPKATYDLTWLADVHLCGQGETE